jgi:subtilisin family serine protease
MRQDRFAPAVISFLWLTACGQIQNGETFNNVTDSCASSVIPHQFVVKQTDGTVKVVQAESEQDFRTGYMKEHAGTIKYAEHDFYAQAAMIQTETSGAMTTTADNWGAVRVDTATLWAQGVRGDQVVVAVVDTGMDINHPQLANQLALNPGENGPDGRGGMKQNNGIDDDQNGYVDDAAGMDFSAAPPKPLAGDNQYHGTHVSGIIAAYHQDTVAGPQPYVQGMAPNAKILPVAFLDSTGNGSMSNAVTAIQYAVARGARVINASWGGSACLQSLKDEIASLGAKNVFFVAAAGNGDSNGVGYDIDTEAEYPASLNLLGQLTVGATISQDYKATYSNYGARAVHIFAPGTNIVSTLPGAQMGYLSGTSMATPFVSGAVALLLSAIPTATVTQVRSALYNSALHNANYVNASQGRMDLATALSELHQITGN